MKRRDFLNTAALGATVLSGGCGSRLPAQGWQTTEQQTSDLRLQLLQFTILAPYSHNTQPWLVELTSGSEMRLYVDRNRLLPASAAREFGYRAAIRYFPEGEDDASGIDERPVAAAEMANIQSSSGTDRVSWRVITGESQRRAGICKEAMAIETSSPARNRETAQWFRFSDRELREKRDAFGMDQNGTEGLTRWIAETFILSRKRAVDPKGAFARGAVTQTKEKADSAPAFAALVGKANTRLDQVLMGRAYARADQTAARLGLEMQPLSQVLAEYPEMAELKKQVKRDLNVTDEETVQMIFRLGHGGLTPNTPRRGASTLIRRAPGIPETI